MLFSQVAKRRCAMCWGPVVRRWTGKHLEICCPKDCEPGGHVSEDFVEHQRGWDRVNATQVAAAYPELIEDRHLSERELEAAGAALFGE